jgi:hypothetical protein
MVYVPLSVFVEVVIVSAESKSGVPDGTLRTGFTPAGAPAMVNDTGELNPFRDATWIV